MTPTVQDLAGRTFDSSRPYEVGREKIREFADAIGDPNPLYRDPEAAGRQGHADVIAPPTFGIVVGFEPLQALLEAAGLSLAQIMHADQKFTAVRPIVPGDRLRATLTVDSVRALSGNDVIATRTDISSVEGEAVVTATAKIIHRGSA